MNYKIINDQKFVKLCLDDYNEKLKPVNNTFKIIVLIDKNFINSVDIRFLNLFEKIEIDFMDLLSQNIKEIINCVMEEMRLKESIEEKKRHFNYNLNN